MAVTHSFKRRLVERGIDEAKIHVITNGVDSSRFSHRPKDDQLEEELALRDKFVAGYIGTHGMAHGLETLIDAAAVLKETDAGESVRILMLGDGAQRASIEQLAAAKGLDNVVFVSSVPKELVARYWSLLDVSIIHLKRNETFKTVIPSKMFECMAMGLPILHGIEGESAEIVESLDCGLLFEPENARQLADRILALATDATLRGRLRDNALAGAGSYDRNTLAEAMLGYVVATAGR